MALLQQTRSGLSVLAKAAGLFSCWQKYELEIT